jgi:hypothetical protein
MKNGAFIKNQCNFEFPFLDKRRRHE